jgi:hypothetical protein
MSSTREEIEGYISRELPASFSSDEILEMYQDLEKDVALLKRAPGMNDSKMGMICQQKFKRFAFSYPGLFFKTLKGEVDPEMLKNMLGIKKKLDENQISLDEARNGVIDGAKEDIKKKPVETRKKKAHAKGTVVQELSFKCKPDESGNHEDETN